jgi:hypothetical protein
MSQGQPVTYSDACRLVYGARPADPIHCRRSKVNNERQLAGLAVPSSTLVRNTGFCFPQGKIELSTRAIEVTSPLLMDELQTKLVPQLMRATRDEGYWMSCHLS